jgi:8-oxo-dGDP phosphatase
MSPPQSLGHSAGEAGEAGEVWLGPVSDSDTNHPLVSRTETFRGRKWSVRTDRVTIGGTDVDRDYVVHTGAVGVIALDDADRVLLIRQYRHPVGRSLFEPPAGLLDAEGEDPLDTAKRELVEEAGYRAASWNVLVDYLTSPGGSSETFRTYLARDLSPVVGGREHTGEAEERDLPAVWVDLDRARDLVLSGEVQNPASVAGILAAWVSRADGWSSLRPADAPWPVRERVRSLGGTPTS